VLASRAGGLAGRDVRPPWEDTNRRSQTKGGKVAETYKPGETVPRDGTVECTQYNGTKDEVKKGTTFAPCDHWGDHHGEDCTWQYVG
jgi:hypothetical protein